MTDWDRMTEHIHHAIHAVDKAHVASRQLRENANRETFDNFRAQLADLTKNLNELEIALNNQEAFALDELSGWLSKAFVGKSSQDRRTPGMHLDTPSAAEG